MTATIDQSATATQAEIAACRAELLGNPAETTAAPAETIHHFLLPRNLACMADLTAKEAIRYAMNGVSLSRTATGYRVEATNARYCAIVTADCPQDAKDFPALSAVTSAPNGATSAVIPTDDWREAFKMIPKARATGGKPILETVAAVLGDKVSTFATTDLARNRSIQPRNVEGRYPPLDEVYPKKAPAAVVKVDPQLLRELLKVAEAFTLDETRAVYLECYSDGAPMVIRTGNGAQAFKGAIMPLS